MPREARREVGLHALVLDGAREAERGDRVRGERGRRSARFWSIVGVLRCYGAGLESFAGANERAELAGTYVRALARDLGEALGCGGYCTELRRLAIGQLSIERAGSLDDVPNPGPI